MKTQTKKKFINAIWITGHYENEIVIGRTFVDRGNKLVALITEGSCQLIVPYDAIIDIKKLTILTQSKPIITRPHQHNNQNDAMDNLIDDALRRINN